MTDNTTPKRRGRPSTGKAMTSAERSKAALERAQAAINGEGVAFADLPDSGLIEALRIVLGRIREGGRFQTFAAADICREIMRRANAAADEEARHHVDIAMANPWQDASEDDKSGDAEEPEVANEDVGALAEKERAKATARLVDAAKKQGAPEGNQNAKKGEENKRDNGAFDSDEKPKRKPGKGNADPARVIARLKRDKADESLPEEPPTDPQAEARRIAREMQAAGAALRPIADELNARGVPTATGRGAWHASTVRKLLA